jgi:uncharacterized protein with GYD domain
VTGRGHLDNLLGEHAKEIGRRVRELREKGTAGTTNNDFKTDAEVKKLLASADTFLAQIEALNKQVKGLETGAWHQLDVKYQTLQKDLTAEIAARKKQVSTKLGTGNKSLPDMEKLLKDSTPLAKRIVNLAQYSVKSKTLMDVSVNKRRFDFNLAEEMGKSKGKALREDEADIFSSLLSDRNLKFAYASANAAYKDVMATIDGAKAAQGTDQAKALKDAQVKVATQLKKLDEVVDKYQKAYDTLGEMTIMTNREGPKIKQTVTAMAAMKQKAHTALTTLPKLKTGA